jgi:hypothetical protein
LLLPWLEQFDAIEFARQEARRHGTLAAEQLTRLTASPARAVLQRLPQFVVTRQM